MELNTEELILLRVALLSEEGFEGGYRACLATTFPIVAKIFAIIFMLGYKINKITFNGFET
ncbi:MAG: hypothetical protein COW63_08905 [Bacteroidetes bacterium CG18_big_fil_WC_8_21_14_2_50_41_14]|nr:MAG: hypothetical protein COW63_08905 [Bacteroidetes bacterium CG18_big_fil_WC_8_21_14_2_50_41_14]PJB55144.1 MAG: hypothetical protein CO098_17880 [Bacteroidetes bacterium CG_4_9_14_3_um_filter_41_19]